LSNNKNEDKDKEKDHYKKDEYIINTHWLAKEEKKENDEK